MRVNLNGCELTSSGDGLSTGFARLTNLTEVDVSSMRRNLATPDELGKGPVQAQEPRHACNPNYCVDELGKGLA